MNQSQTPNEYTTKQATGSRQLVPLLLRLATRNLLLYKFRTSIIGGLLGFGAFLAVVGLSLLRDVEFSMRESITGSVVGDIQIYSNQAKDDLAVFGGGFMGRADIGTIPDITPVRNAALTVDNVAAVLPMGGDMVFLGRGNELDESLDSLRAALKSGERDIVAARVDHLRFQISQLKLELEQQGKVVSDSSELQKNNEAIATVETPGWLEAFTASDSTVDLETRLQYLETRIAPISGEKQPIYLNYIGTDVPLFAENFPKFKIREGTTIPSGSRGILISRKFREDMLKNLTARLFDKLHKRVVQTEIKIKDDPENRRLAGDLARQYNAILENLDRQEATALSAELATFGIAAKPAANPQELLVVLTEQLTTFLTIDDDNFLKRYEWFYSHIAPRLKQYEISPGETITLRSYTRSGYIKSVPLKVYGVFTFDGLEDSDLAGAMNIIDLVSFRELFGQMTAASREELQAMRQEIGIKEIAQADAEATLFGGETTIEASSENSTSSGGNANDSASKQVKFDRALTETFDPSEVRAGMALNAAIRLKDPSKLTDTIDKLKGAFAAQKLDLRVVDWQTAAGIAGQFVVIVRLALVFSLVIIFIVALVIINNTIIVGTLNRFREIGTMRAIGAQRSFVVGLFLAESAVTGLISAIFGAFIAAIVLAFLARNGIPAGNDFVTFLFSGPKLYPMVRWPLVLAAPVLVTVIATAASLFAARHAARVTPAEAMQEKE